MSKQTTIGVISDTHGLLRAEALAVLKTCDVIMHAGDIGSLSVLEELREIAPLHVVRGNVDAEAWAMELPTTEMVEVDGVYFYILHNINHLDIDPASAGVNAVIFGHSHRQNNETEEGVLYFNPASIGPRRFSLPISMGLIKIKGTEIISAEFVDLEQC